MTHIISSLTRSIKFPHATNNILKRLIYITPKQNALFYEKDPKGGYVQEKKKIPKTQQIREGLKELKQEIQLWSNEMKEKFETDPFVIHRPGETDIQWNFENEKSLNKWVVTSDSDHNEGYSSCSLTLNKYGKAVFAGVLNTKVPKDGRVQRAGYCNMKTIRARKSFKRDAYHDWTNYNVLVLRVRGDGRSYMLNVATSGYFDVMWNDVYNYILFTRGGPYWQLTKIPFSKFFLSSKGRIQDRQDPIHLSQVTSLGITAGDKINGNFQLEIDYIGLEFDPNITEEFAYEMYKTDKYIVAN